MSESFPNAYLHVDGIDVQVTRLADGLGFGHGSISRFATEGQSGNEDLSGIVDEAIRSSQILVPVGRHDSGETVDDDGCPDGRGVLAVFAGNVIFKSSLHRPKVFGGGATMVTATRIGAGLAVGNNLEAVFEDGVEQALDRNIKIGGHTDSHAHGDNCGCGAIDRAPAIVVAVPQYGPNIEQVIQLIAGEAQQLTATEHPDRTDLGIFDHYRLASSLAARQYAGSTVMQKLVDSRAVIKQLADDHRETRIVWNRVRGHTVNQAFVRERTGGRAQVFGVDEWRMEDIALSLYENPADQRRAFLSEMAYALGTAAVLTKGDLPVDLLEPIS